MTKQNRKKLSYKQYAGLLTQAHQKLDIVNQKLDMLAQKYEELQTYFIAYVEYQGQNVLFNDWMNVRIKEMEAEVQKKKEMKKREEHVNEKV